MIEMAKDKSIKCYVCKKVIERHDRYCSLNSYSNGELNNIDYFHARCWLAFLDEVTDKRMKAVIGEVMPVVEKTFRERGF